MTGTHPGEATDVPILDHTADDNRREERLRNDLIAWLGSVRPDGRPHLVPVWFYWDGEALLVLSQPHTQKVRNLRSDSRVTIALDDTRIGRDIVLLEGVATLMPGSAGGVRRSAAVAAYLAKYAGMLAEMQWSPEAYLADYAQALSIRPTRCVVW